MHPNIYNRSRPQALLNVHRSERRYDERGSYASGNEVLNGIELNDRRVCHIENIIRAEHKIELRSHYFANYEGPRLLDSGGKEIIHGYNYTDPSTVERNYKSQPTMLNLKPKKICF